MSRKLDLKGQRFGRLVVCSESHTDDNNQVHWHCLCDCGTNFTAKTAMMRAGKTQSCGCYGKEQRRKARLRHGQAGSYEYKRYMGMKNRCYNENDINYQRYGAKGVTVDSTWLGEDGFVTFMRDMGPMPERSRKWTIERKDCSKGYGPNNCKWLLESMQSKNKTKICTNTSGVTGVNFETTSNGTIRVRAIWCDIDGKIKTKSFSTNKYGDDEAFRLACEYRTKMIEELNAQGAGYTDSHGK